MKLEYWLDRWLNHQIGFHEEHGSSLLREFWPTVCVKSPCQVFVPLCGKSKDISWLADHNHRVSAVEISELAVSAFFSEAGLNPTQTEQDGFVVWTAGKVKIWQGDFFKLQAHHLDSPAFIWDRDALVALPVQWRQRYITHMALICPAAVMLLATVEYAQEEMQGPPFSVSKTDLQHYLGDRHLDCLYRKDVLQAFPRFMEKGLSGLFESVYSVQL